MGIIVEYYSEKGDITFLMEETWTQDGKPTKENTEFYKDKGIVAKYDDFGQVIERSKEL